MSSQTVIVAGRREAGDSFDFHLRHGRALQARAARAGFELLLTRLRSRRRRPQAAPRGWHVEWPVGPETSHCGRR